MNNDRKAIPTEVWDYFIEKYNKASFRVVPGHWPNFQTKEEVDEWISFTEKIFRKYERVS